MTAIMERVSAYSRKTVTFEEMMNSDMKLDSDTFIIENVDYIAEVPVPETIKRKG
jgi:hypothetical protein